MTLDSLQRANELKCDIDTLKEEIRILENSYNKISYSLQLLFGVPAKKNYNKLYCLRDMDSIQSGVMIRDEEIKALIDCKNAKLNELKKQLEAL